jgi:hypothetical protein
MNRRLAPEFQDISFNKWLQTLPEQADVSHTNLKKEDFEKIPETGEPILR